MYNYLLEANENLCCLQARMIGALLANFAEDVHARPFDTCNQDTIVTKLIYVGGDLLGEVEEEEEEEASKSKRKRTEGLVWPVYTLRPNGLRVRGEVLHELLEAAHVHFAHHTDEPLTHLLAGHGCDCVVLGAVVLIPA
jgi:hypothetical protein